MTCERENTPSDGAVDESIDSDAADATVVVHDARMCFGSGLASICLSSLPTAPRTLNGAIDTDSDPSCETYTGTDLNRFCVISATNVMVSSINATGSKPLVLIATAGTITITGTFELASHRVGPVRGAGGTASSCVAGEGAGAGQGGPGGSFGGKGGSGGNGEQGGGLAAAAPATAPTTLRGGCKGGNGSNGAAGGNGGGAVYLIAVTSIAVTGSINASGAAGAKSGANEQGGGGGGSGGMIALEAPTITGTGSMFANGAGGGAGNDESTNAEEPTSALVIANGGDDTADSGRGGNGSVGGTLGGTNGGTGGDGGGGGGGGAGVIRLFPPQTITLSASPPPS